MFQVSEQTEKARTDSTGRPGDPDFNFFQILKKNAFRQSKISVSKAHTIFAIDSNIGLFAEYDRRLKITNVVADQKQVFYQCVRYCRLPDVIRQRHPLMF